MAKEIPGELIGGRFEIVRQLAVGAVSTSLLCRDRTSEVLRVVKVIHSSIRRCTNRREHVSWAIGKFSRIRSPQLVHIVDARFSVNEAWYATEFCRQGHEESVEFSALSRSRQLTALRGITSGLSALHLDGYVHRSVSLENVVLADDGSAKLAESPFMVTTNSEISRYEVSADVDYVPPEFLFDGHATNFFDIYCLGILAHVMLTNAVPFSTSSRRVADIAHPEFAISRDLCPKSRILIARMLGSASPHYRHVGEVLNALNELCA